MMDPNQSRRNLRGTSGTLLSFTDSTIIRKNEQCPWSPGCEILQLSEQVREAVGEQFGIALEREVTVVE